VLIGVNKLASKLNALSDLRIHTLTLNYRAKPKSLFAKTSSKNLGVPSGSMFGEQIPTSEEKKTDGL